jgi:hypothetical protein
MASRTDACASWGCYADAATDRVDPIIIFIDPRQRAGAARTHNTDIRKCSLLVVNTVHLRLHLRTGVHH